jgi:hypothetical protein
MTSAETLAELQRYINGRKDRTSSATEYHHWDWARNLVLRLETELTEEARERVESLEKIKATLTEKGY